MTTKLVIMLLNSNPDIPATLGTPFFQAMVAATMDLEVEIYFASRAASLLRKGVAENLYPGKDKPKSVYAFMKEAHDAGVKFFLCGGAMEENDITEENAIAELDGVRGSAAFLSEAVEDYVLALTY
jgi:predicted peroxiredoxin